MEIFEVKKTEFTKIISNPYHNYGTANFNELNKYKCNSVYYLIFKEKKYRLGIVGGIIDNSIYSSYSAPFGGFLYLKKDIKIRYIDSAVDLLIKWCKTKNLDTINITLPPPFYEEGFISKQSNSLYRKGFKISTMELNYAFFTNKFDDDYYSEIWRNARNNIRKALKGNLNFHKCETIEEKKEAYEIIKQHKKVKNYPLKLTWKQILETVSLIEADFFIVSDFDTIPIAAAIIFHVGKSIVQIIYWGDLMKYSHLRTMNFLSYKLFEYYNQHNYKIIDLGPSSENSIPNSGLCDFKESIGCDICLKKSFSLSLK